LPIMPPPSGRHLSLFDHRPIEPAPLRRSSDLREWPWVRGRTRSVNTRTVQRVHKLLWRAYGRHTNNAPSDIPPFRNRNPIATKTDSIGHVRHTFALQYIRRCKFQGTRPIRMGTQHRHSFWLCAHCVASYVSRGPLARGLWPRRARISDSDMQRDICRIG
jgi:hypothetical protein